MEFLERLFDSEIDDICLKRASSQSFYSNDPSTRIGAIILKGGYIIGSGYNRFPRGIEDFPKRWERPAKYDYVLHAEQVALMDAMKHRYDITGSRLYLYGMGPPTVPCLACARLIIEAGITSVAGRAYKLLPDAWENECANALQLLNEAGIEFDEL